MMSLKVDAVLALGVVSVDDSAISQ